MSKKAKAIQNLYNMGRVTLEAVHQSVAEGYITEAEYQTIM